MIIAERIRELMASRDLTQAELARRVGLSQQSIAKLANGRVFGSSHLHKVARALGTTAEYLTGEIDDPDLDAPLPQPEPTIQLVSMAVALPGRAVLADMFVALLRGVPAGASKDETAQTLAELLPIGLGQLQAGLLRQAPVLADDAASLPEADASDDPAPRRVQRR